MAQVKLSGRQISVNTASIESDRLFAAYEAGVDYGLYLAEMERISEGMCDAALCYVHSQKFNTPSAPARRRQDRSQAWLEKMGSGQRRFLELIVDFLINQNLHNTDDSCDRYRPKEGSR